MYICFLPSDIGQDVCSPRLQCDKLMPIFKCMSMNYLILYIIELNYIIDIFNILLYATDEFTLPHFEHLLEIIGLFM
jgi:hypothetical protein